MTTLNPREYDLVVHRPYPPLLTGFIFSGYAQAQHFRPLLKKPFAYQNILIIDGDWFYPRADQRKLVRLTYSSWRDPVFFRRSVRILRSREQALLAAALKTDYKRYRTAYESYMPALAMTFIIDAAVERDMHSALRKKLSPSEADELMHALNIPLEDNYLRRETCDLAKTHDFAGHARKYAWLFARYGGRKTYTRAMALRKYKTLDPRQVVVDYRRQKAATRAAIAKAKKILSPADRHLVDLMQFIVFYRTHRTDVMNRSSYEFYPGLIRKAKEIGAPYRDFLYLSPAEVEKRDYSLNDVEHRKRGYACVYAGGEYWIAQGDELHTLRRRFTVDTPTKRIIHGTAASPGLIQGAVKIVRNARELSKVRTGDVLVTTMTTPDFISAMHRAAAFVTDEGGITCHAAIVSREMKKPCVIGTKIATKVLKDGDRVEVDATRGIVKKL